MDQTILFVILLGAPAAGAAISLLPRDGIEVVASLVSAAISVGVSILFFALGTAGTFGYFYADGLTRVMAVTISAVF